MVQLRTQADNLYHVSAGCRTLRVLVVTWNMANKVRVFFAVQCRDGAAALSPLRTLGPCGEPSALYAMHLPLQNDRSSLRTIPREGNPLRKPLQVFLQVFCVFQPIAREKEAMRLVGGRGG